ncbi:MAG: phosphate signaling complex protein PhoU [Chloroflexota bacterium]|nr:phosphate signaling complex protein PhoU [Chloroflexota bacterium]PLS78125.1 MAG: phosphate transport system regulatory protein PhoU [Chloroflexota bacterium]
MPREQYDRQLKDLQDSLLRLASQVEGSIGRAVEALKTQDVDEARRIIADDDAIDRAQYAIEDAALLLIARQAPMAADLRMISAVISIASELERMGDYAEGIAEIVIRGANEPLLKPLANIPRMAQIAQRMLREALDAFVNRDAEAARRLGATDDQVDQLTTVIQNELLRIMVSEPTNIERALHLMFVAHNLERVADRATNIGERLIFLVTGQVVDLND